MKPDNDYSTEITPKEFEIEVRKFFEEQDRIVTSYKVIEDTIIEKPFGNFQIDVIITFDLVGLEFKVLVECKRYNTAIKRETVQVLHDKVKLLGANKGVLISTTGFQSGAIKYAKEFGIGLIRFIDGKSLYLVKSWDKDFVIPEDVKIPKFEFQWYDTENEDSCIITSLSHGYKDDFFSSFLKR